MGPVSLRLTLTKVRLSERGIGSVLARAENGAEMRAGMTRVSISRSTASSWKKCETHGTSRDANSCSLPQRPSR
jgi:hypothetical protein